MQKRSEIILSNRLEPLVEELIRRLFSSSHPFERRRIVVPHLKLKPYLLQSFAENPSLNIAAGVEIVTPLQAIGDLKMPSVVQLALEIEEEILKVIAKRTQESYWQPLLSYMEGKKSKRCLTAFCLKLARLFIRYGLYGGEFLKEWLEQEGWQQELWRRIYREESQWTFPYKTLKDKIFEGEEQLHLFHFNFLPPLYQRFFKRAGATFYLLSPSSYFWGDLCTDKERVRLHQKIKSEQEKEELDRYLSEQNPFLANMARLGRDFLNQLEDLETKEFYVEEHDSSTLGNVQSALFELSSLPPAIKDATIQVYKAPSKLREVETLVENLYALFKDGSILPSDVRVLSPDISDYLPYIRMVFDAPDCPLDYAIEDLPLSVNNAFISAFMHLLSLPSARFDYLSLLKLFTCPAFLAKFSLTAEEVTLFKNWIEKAGIRWAVDTEQKRLFLKEKEVENGGTWEEGFNRLLQGLTTQNVQEANSYPVIEFKEALVLGKLIEIVESLKADLFPLLENRKLTVEEGLIYLHCLAESYFLLEREDQGILQELASLARNARHLKELFPLSHLVDYMQEQLFYKKGAKLHSAKLHAIRMSSLTEGSAVGARVIYLLGMQEGAFPRVEAEDSLCALTPHPKRDYLPQKKEEDRLIFLQQLLLAKEYFFISYQSLSEQDGKEENPSIVVQELLSYLKGIEIKSSTPKSFIKKQREPQEPPLKTPPPQVLEIDVRDLLKLARHPLQFFLNKSLGIWLEREEKEEFLLSNWDRAILRNEALKISLEEVKKRREAELPRGVFTEIAFFKLQEEVEEIKNALSNWDISVDQIESVELLPLSVPLPEGREAKIVGKIPDVTPQGLLVHTEGSFKDLVKIWPLFLVYLLALKERAVPSLLFSKSGEKRNFNLHDPLSLLSCYISYYEKALERPSPFMPDWTEAILKEKKLNLQKKAEREEDKYLSYFLQLNEPTFDLAMLSQEWKERAREIFEALEESHATL